MSRLNWNIELVNGIPRLTGDCIQPNGDLVINQPGLSPGCTNVGTIDATLSLLIPDTSFLKSGVLKDNIFCSSGDASLLKKDPLPRLGVYRAIFEEINDKKVKTKSSIHKPGLGSHHNYRVTWWSVSGSRYTESAIDPKIINGPPSSNLLRVVELLIILTGVALLSRLFSRR